MSRWLISVPNQEGSSSESTFNRLVENTASSRNDFAECHRFELPKDLLVGTLDSLMTLSEELHRVDMATENVVRKVERQFHELQSGDESLSVHNVPIDRYLNHFTWDEAKHPHRRPLSEIVSIIQATMGKVEDELKQLGSMYSEKKQQMLAMQRKKGGNLMMCNLDDILTPEVVSEDDFVNTEYLKTVVVIVPKNSEPAWLEEYERLGADIAEFGPEGRRNNTKGSPVVPRSARKLLEEGDSVLYTVTLLRGQYQAGHIDEDGNFEQGVMRDYVEEFKNLAREKKYIVREFEYRPTAHKDNQKVVAELEVEVDRLWSGLLRWCNAHFGETFIAWMHIKAIRMFVESVLRYGLPVNFVVVIYKPHSGKDTKLRAALNRLYGHLQPSEFAVADEGPSAGEFYPYVSNTFHPLAA